MFRNVRRELDQVPRIVELTRGFRRLAPGLASGEDVLPPELFINFPHVLARAYHPVMVEASLTLAEPVQWKGGLLAFFPKPAGREFLRLQQRNCFLRHPGQILSRVSPAAAAAPPHCESQTVADGRPPSSVDRLRQHSFAGSLGAKPVPRAFLRGDLRGHNCVFYNLRRRFLVPDTDQLNEAGALLRGTVVARLGTPDHLAAAVAAAYHVTWFTQQHNATSSLFENGVLPDDSEADVLFTIVILEALDELQQQLVAADLVDPSAPVLTVRVFSAHLQEIPEVPADVSYVDDSDVVVEGAAGDLLERLGRTCTIMQVVFEEFGWPVNYAPGKTEVVVGFHGAGARTARLELTFGRQGCIQFGG
jgi:hypothetical protein